MAHPNGNGHAHRDGDEELMRALAGGSDDAMRELYRRHAPLVFAIASRSLDRAAAEEIVQDVFLALWRAAASFDAARGPLRPWLLQIAHHRILNELRRRGRRVQLESLPEGEPERALPDPSPDPQSLVWLEFRRAALRTALDELPPPQRQALALAFLEELTHEQVAETLQLRLGTAKTRIRAGLRALRRRLAPLAASLALIALAGAAFVIQREYTVRSLDERALDLATSSDVVPLRLEAAPGVAAETHATYRGRAGSDVAVLTLSHFPSVPVGSAFHAWALQGGVWRWLGSVTPGADGRARLVLQDAELATPPDALEITLESVARPAMPSDSFVVRWPASK